MTEVVVVIVFHNVSLSVVSTELGCTVCPEYCINAVVEAVLCVMGHVAPSAWTRCGGRWFHAQISSIGISRLVNLGSIYQHTIESWERQSLKLIIFPSRSYNVLKLQLL